MQKLQSDSRWDSQLCAAASNKAKYKGRIHQGENHLQLNLISSHTSCQCLITSGVTDSINHQIGKINDVNMSAVVVFLLVQAKWHSVFSDDHTFLQSAPISPLKPHTATKIDSCTPLCSSVHLICYVAWLWCVASVSINTTLKTEFMCYYDSRAHLGKICP